MPEDTQIYLEDMIRFFPKFKLILYTINQRYWGSNYILSDVND